MSNHIHAVILFSDGPIVKCYSRQASLDEKNVFIQCDVRARPPLSTLYWLIDVNGTTVAEGKVKEEYWTLVMVTRLLFRIYCFEYSLRSRL